eukprot:8709525-Pyramimonas_sp.AAC.1
MVFCTFFWHGPCTRQLNGVGPPWPFYRTSNKNATQTWARNAAHARSDEPSPPPSPPPGPHHPMISKTRKVLASSVAGSSCKFSNVVHGCKLVTQRAQPLTFGPDQSVLAPKQGLGEAPPTRRASGGLSADQGATLM